MSKLDAQVVKFFASNQNETPLTNINNNCSSGNSKCISNYMPTVKVPRTSTSNLIIDFEFFTKNNNIDINYNVEEINMIIENYYTWPILFLSVFVLVGFIGNLMVCLAIKIDPKLQNATSYYLFSLAVTDLLVSVLVIPLAIFKNFSRIWTLGTSLCLMWIFLDVLLCTTSILLLCVISCERFIGIDNPLKNREKSKSKTKIIILIILLIALIFSSPILILSYLDTKNILLNGECTIFNKHFKIYGSIFSFIIPLIIMFTMYCLTVKRLQKVLKEFKLKGKKKFASRLKQSTPLQLSNSINETRSLLKKTFKINQLSSGSLNSIKANNLSVKSHSICINNNIEASPITNISIKENLNNKSQNNNSLNRKFILESFICKKNQKSKESTLSINQSKPNDEDAIVASNECSTPVKKLNSSNSLDISTKNVVDSNTKLSNLILQKIQNNQNNANINSSPSMRSFRAAKNANETTKNDHSTNNTISQGNDKPVSNGNHDTISVNSGRKIVNNINNNGKFKQLVNKHRLINRTVNAFRTSRESAAVKNEQKAVKVLGIVFGIFIIAWVPFSIINIITALCVTSCSLYNSILNICSWLGYISCVINPFVYNAFNEKFRYAFKQIAYNVVKCKCNFKSVKNKENLKREVNLIMQKLYFHQSNGNLSTNKNSHNKIDPEIKSSNNNL